VLNEAPHHEDVEGDLGTRWSWVVSFTLRPLYFQRKRPR